MKLIGTDKLPTIEALHAEGLDALWHEAQSLGTIKEVT
jgi:hypothetical protein